MSQLYGPTIDAIYKPRRKKIKQQWVGIGGEIIIKRGANEQQTIIPEANDTQYEWLYKVAGLNKLVRPIDEAAKKAIKAEQAALKQKIELAKEPQTIEDEIELADMAAEKKNLA